VARKRKPALLHVLLVGTAVVLFWRGAWGLIDLYLFPDNEVLSYISSLVLGVGILILTHKLVDELE
jgi:hypothetical protein